MDGSNHSVYLVTEDVQHAFGGCSNGSRAVVYPRVLAACRDELYRGLRSFIGNDELVVFREQEFCDALQALREQVCASLARPFVVGLDRFVRKPDGTLEVTRISVRNDAGVWEKLRGIVARPRTPPFPEQIARLARQSRGREVVLVEDGLWSSDTMTEIVAQCRGAGINVAAVVAGLVCAEEKVPADLRRLLHAAHWFGAARRTVHDWICERDFYVGVPGFGRTLGLLDQSGADPRSIGIPYSLPHGDPAAWASIRPEHQHAFSRLCTAISARLFESLERQRGKLIRVRDLATVPYGMQDVPGESVRALLGEWQRALG